MSGQRHEITPVEPTATRKHYTCGFCGRPIRRYERVDSGQGTQERLWDWRHRAG